MNCNNNGIGTNVVKIFSSKTKININRLKYCAFNSIKWFNCNGVCLIDSKRANERTFMVLTLKY